jgi:hypothetical protein
MPAGQHPSRRKGKNSSKLPASPPCLPPQAQTHHKPWAICLLAYGEFAVVEQGGFQLGEEFVLEPLRL